MNKFQLAASLYLIENISRYPDGTPKISKTQSVLSKLDNTIKLGDKTSLDKQSQKQKSVYSKFVKTDKAETDMNIPNKVQHI
jgi:hypothetical protein